MAYKYKTVTVKDASFLSEELKDFLVDDCGWTDESPSGQDDEMGAGDYHGILGHFLKSTGEDGNDDIYLHLFNNKTDGSSQYRSHNFPAFSYLSSGIGSTDGTATIDDDTELALVSTPFAVRMNDELAIVSSVSGGTVTFSQRGAYGTTNAAHSAGDLILDTDVRPYVEAYAFRDLTENLVASSGTAGVGKKSATSVPGMTGYGDDRFNLHGLLKVVDGAEAGKMRPITDYASSSGDLDYLAFKNSPGTSNVAVVADGFLPGCSRRMGTSYYCGGRIEMADQGTDTVCWFYGSKDSVVVVTKWDAGYSVFFAGNVIPFSAKDNAFSTAQASAGGNTMDVDDRNLFAVGEKYRIISQDAGDWATNEDRPLTEPDLDPEEIPTEEVVIQGITPGSGNAGTLTFNANLIYTYSTGAVIGEDPRPVCRSAPDYAVNISAGRDIAEGTDCWLPVYNPCDKTALASHASHRQTWRSVHASGDPETPDEANFYTRFRGIASRDINAEGEVKSSLDDNFKSKQNDRPTCGLINLYNSDPGSTYNARGIFPAMKGVMQNIWYTDTNGTVPPYSASAEDTYEARWGGSYEEFRLFLQRAATNTFFLCGPELS